MRSSKKRSRSNQNRPRSLGNIVNRVFDSSGPEGKVRGTPQQIIEKYQGLARDAQLSNDRVAAENFLQHAEHYTRMLAEAQRELAAEQEARQQHYQSNGNNNRGDYRDRNDRNDYRNDRAPGTEEQPHIGEAIEFAGEDVGLVELPESLPIEGGESRFDQRSEQRAEQRPEQRHEPRQERNDYRNDRNDNRGDNRNDNRNDRQRNNDRRYPPRNNNERFQREDRAPREDRRPRREADAAELPAFISAPVENVVIAPAPVAAPLAAPAPAPVAAPAAAPFVEAPAVATPATEAEAKPAARPRAPRKPRAEAAEGEAPAPKAPRKPRAPKAE